MDPKDLFSTKAEVYHKFRWGYAPKCIQTITETARITDQSRVADIGAGTGILTREFAWMVGQIYAIEPNPEMRSILKQEMAPYPGCQVLAGQAESTGLEDDSVDLVTAAQAVHFFDPYRTRGEFRRILVPGGWLAFCRNYGTNRELNQAIQAIFPPKIDTEPAMIGLKEPKSYYFGGEEYLFQETPFQLDSNWDVFFGSLTTSSSAPDPDSTYYSDFKQEARAIFEQFNLDGAITIRGMTELYLGRIR